MVLYLRKVVHPQAHENYRVILKLDGSELEIGSIGIQHGAAWRWGIDTVIPMRVLETQGKGKDRGIVPTDATMIVTLHFAVKKETNGVVRYKGRTAATRFLPKKAIHLGRIAL